ncbi:MAG: helix-turn-helix domain-containing protein [Silicimonas sp.]|nr:helix-turn-helix domain-containing protein [Silicimonas sp.]
MTRPFTLDLSWATLLSKLKIRPADLLRQADLPEDLFLRARPMLQPDAFLRLWAEMSTNLDTDTPGLMLAKAISPEAFSPPLFAAYCSPNLIVAVERLALYKPLIGPLILEGHNTIGGLEVTYGAEPEVELPAEFIGAELAFLVNLARLGSKTGIRPIAVEMVQPPVSKAYADFFGRPVRKGPFNRVVFTREDAEKRFLSANPALFTSFEPDLRARLDQMERGASVKDKVRSVLMESLPSGQGDTATVAKRLGVSPRGLQRKLAAEKTSFQSELRALRRRLAETYLLDTDLSSPEIAFLLGYADPNSFIRAFHIWTGTTPEAHRSAARAI